MANALLTLSITSPSDLKRVRRELEQLDEYLHQAGLRGRGSGATGTGATASVKTLKMPATSRQLEDLAGDSSLNLLKKTDRMRLSKFLSLLCDKAPVLHMSFASEPSAKFINRLLVWLRANIHPQVLISIGLQPSIAAGCIVRTANRQFDFTLRQSLEAQTGALINSLRPETTGAINSASTVDAASQPAVPETPPAASPSAAAPSGFPQRPQS